MVRPISYSGQPSHSTSPSITSLDSSLGSIYFLPQHMPVTPPAYISLDAANGLVFSYLTREPGRPPTFANVALTPEGLRIVNSFLDYILREFLARAKSTSIARLREAVGHVVRTALGTTAMIEAEAELANYLHDSDRELYTSGDHLAESANNTEHAFNLERVWTKARIKCMLYSTTGDKEEHDFDEESDDEADYAVSAPGQKLSPAGAIYLTSVLETIGEHCLFAAGRTAFSRLDPALRTNNNPTFQLSMIIEEADVKRGIAEDELTTRIWRKWKRSERVFATMSEISANHYGVPRRSTDSRTGFETLTQLPFTSLQVPREVDRRDIRRSSIMSAPDMSRNDSITSIDSSQSLPLHSPSKASPARRSRHRHSKVYAPSGIDLIHFRGSVTDIRDTLGERGVVLPDTPPHGVLETPLEEFQRPHRLSALTEGSQETWSSYPGSARGKAPLPSSQLAEEEDGDTEYEDAVATARRESHDSAMEQEQDSLKTPTLKYLNIPAPEPPSDPQEIEEDVYVMGGESGLDYSIWETKPPPGQRFYFSPPSSKPGSIHTEVSCKEIPSPEEQDLQPIMSAQSTPVNAQAEEEITEPFSIETARSTPVGILPKVGIPDIEVSDLEMHETTSSTVTAPRLPQILGGEDWPSHGVISPTSLTVETDDSDVVSNASNHVENRVTVPNSSPERILHSPTPVDFDFEGLSLFQTQGPVYISHTELTPIMETSRESTGSDAIDAIISARLRSSASRSSDHQKDGRSSPTPTGHSHGSSVKAPASPPESIHSTDKARSPSLTSQAERLRNKFLNRKMVIDGDLTVDTLAANHEKMERRMKFESLIRSGETMKMTLTPTSLRSIEGEAFEEQRTLPERVQQQVEENSTRELSNFLRSTGPESYHGVSTSERRGSVPTIVYANDNSLSSPKPQSIRSVPPTSITRGPPDPPPIPSSKRIARSAAGSDPERSTLQLAAFIRTTGPRNGAYMPPITLPGDSTSPKPTSSSVHPNGDSSNGVLLKHRTAQSQRYPPSPSASTQHGTLVDDDDDSSEDLELSMYPGARRKQKNLPQEESLIDFLRNTGPPDSALPPTPATPKAFKDRFPKKRSQTNIRSETPQPKAVDVFTTAKSQPSRVMSPTPSIRTSGPITHRSYQAGASIRTMHTTNPSFSNAINVNFPSSPLMAADDFFPERSQRTQSLLSRQSSLRQFSDADEIQRTPRSIRPGNVAREPVVTRSQTDSLAEFLRSTGPGDFGEPTPKAVKKSKSGFFRRLMGGGNSADKAGRLSRSGSLTTSGRYTPIVIPGTVRN